MARARSIAALGSEETKAGESYRARVIFAARRFELHPSKSSASALLGIIPKGAAQENVWQTFGDSLCRAEPISDMAALDRFGARLSRDLARAVLVDSTAMRPYIAYGITAVLNPHSDYAVQMQTVCRAKHDQFARAVEALSTNGRSELEQGVIDPISCRARNIPEAE
jgi:hypothetical protein